MGKYFHLFETETEFNEERNNNYKEPWVSYTKPTSAVTYNKSKREIPLTFEITGDGNIVWRANNTEYASTIEYKKNDGEWTSITSSFDGTNISVVSGDTVQFRGNNATYSNSEFNFSSFGGVNGTTCQFKAKGNIMSLLNPTGFASATTLESAYTFNRLFMSCSGLTDVSNLILPATTLTPNCYFMMFARCTNLTKAPELPALTLVSDCYNGMFVGCTNLNYIKCLATNISASSCTAWWLSGVASSGTFVKNPAMASWPTGASGIPTNWTVQDAN